jgi:hypothetical protein
MRGRVPQSMYAAITPHHLAALSLRRAVDALEQTEADRTTWFFVVLDLHRALYCALIAALSGSAGIGAYSDKLRAEWIDYFEKSRDDPDVERPKKDRVETFENLLERAEKSTLQLQNAPLQLTPEQQADILKLNEFRDDLEHVKPRTWFLGVGGLPRMGANAAKVFAALLPSFSHQLEPEEIAQVEAAILKLEQLGLKYPSSPPRDPE